MKLDLLFHSVKIISIPSHAPAQSDEIKAPETATDESKNEGIDYVDDSIYYGAST